MARPVLVNEYTGSRSVPGPVAKRATIPTLPPITAYAFADIVRSADGPEFQSAIDGIAEICARNRLSLAEEHGSHRPPVGEITEASSSAVGPQLRKPGVHRALTSVPEASSGSSEGSHLRKALFSLRKKSQEQSPVIQRSMCIGIARTLRVESTTALSTSPSSALVDMHSLPLSRTRSVSNTADTAVVSLRSLLASMVRAAD